jgi:4-amino-4-deoxy-L-arabinose transferase-like glycosyltransferase
VLWSFLVPVLEAPDEGAHWQYVRHLHDTHRLPVYGPSFLEANSPPLYYALLAPLGQAGAEPPHLAWLGLSGELVLPAPPRYFLNAGDDLSRYWNLRRARILTAALSAFAVLFTFLAGREATGHATTGLLAAALVAFLPQFTFRGMNISNDALVTTLGAASLYWILRIARRGFTWRDGVLATLVMAGAFLSKINAVFMPAVFALVLLREPVAWPVRVRRLGLLAFGLLLAAPWLVRNHVLYGDPLASRVMLSAVDFLVAHKPITSPYFYTTFPVMLGQSFVGVFGWLNLYLPTWAYVAYSGLGAAAIAGWLRRPPRARHERTALMALVAFALLGLAMVVRINLDFNQPQGRYLFPALAAIAVLTAGGLERLPRWSPRAAGVVAAALLVANLAIAWRVVARAYWPAPVARLSAAQLALDSLAPAHLDDVGSQTFRVTGAEPSLTADVSARASDYSILQFALQGAADGRLFTGAVSFVARGTGPDVTGTLPFVWKADGTPRTVLIPLFTHPEWKGEVTRLRIAPFGRAEAEMGASVGVASAQLRGSL